MKSTGDATTTRLRRRRSDGEISHRTILDAAARLATLEGLEGMSIGRLAKAIGMSKSGLFAHFESKEELQLAIVSSAQEVVFREVVAPAMRAAEGLPRLEVLCERFLSYVERAVFPGGCFFAAAAAEWDSRPGPVRDRIAAVSRGWIELVETALRQAKRRGELGRLADPAQLTFEINALLAEANGLFLLHNDRGAFDRARRGIRERISRAGGDRKRRR